MEFTEFDEYLSDLRENNLDRALTEREWNTTCYFESESVTKAYSLKKNDIHSDEQSFHSISNQIAYQDYQRKRAKLYNSGYAKNICIPFILLYM